MPLEAAEIDQYRNLDYQDTLGYLAHVNLGSLRIRQTNISGVQVTIRTESGDRLSKLHNTSIERAVATVTAAGHNLPPINFYLCSDDYIPNVAMKTYTGNNPSPVIFLGPNMWAKNPMLRNTGNLVVGGVGRSGQRGVANQQYDGTSRFFGNPRQKAQGETIVIHELGHILHEMNNPGVFWEEQQAIDDGQARSPNGAGWIAASASVSAYAGKNALEFVAEVFAGIVTGKNYDATVMAPYRALGGP